jgi:hypothetical protein
MRIFKLSQLDNLVGIDTLLEISVENVNGHELKEYNLSNIAKCFKNLQKFDIHVYDDDDDIIQLEEYAQTVQDVFKNSVTRVVIYFEKSSYTTYQLNIL